MNIHVVQQGDTIDSIAEYYGVSISKLIQDNELFNANSLIPGQTIVIVYPSQSYTVQEGDTLEAIATHFDVSIMELLQNNPFLVERPNLYPGETLVIRYETNGQMATNGFSYPFINEVVLRKTLPYLTYLTVYNYRAEAGGNIFAYFDDTQTVQLAREYAVVPLVMITTLTPQGEPDFRVAYELLLNEDYQNKQIENILTIIRTKGYSGVNFLFNFMSVSNQKLYENFITIAVNRIHSEGYLVFVTINPNISNANNEVVFEQIDYSSISKIADSIIFLQFIWGINYGYPAPVTSINNLEIFVEHAISYVPQNKFIIGTPIISYDWALPYIPERSYASSLTINAALSIANDTGSTIYFDDISQTPYFQYYQSSIGSPIEHIVWFIDARSIDGLINLVIEYGLEGTGIWSIMVYAPQLWLIINSQYEIVKYNP